jgi:PAS domain S-box-containing protein
MNGQQVVLAVVRDITDRKQFEEALKESELKYRTLVETMPDGLDVFDEKGCFTYVNSRFCNILGYESRELLGHHYSEFLDEHNQKKMEIQLSKRRDGIEEPYEIDWTKKDGSNIVALMSPKRITDKEGNFKGSFAVITDITDRKRIEEEQIRLSTAIDQAAESIIITDTDGNIQYVNPAFERISGYLRDEAIGQNPRILQSGKHDLEFYTKLWDTIKAGNVWEGHFINKRKDGKFYEEEATISPVRDKTGRVINYVAVKRDVTEHVRLEEQLRQAQKMESIGTLAGGIAHDFNNI